MSTTTASRAFSIFLDDAPAHSTVTSTCRLSVSSSRTPSRGTTPAPADKENKENAHPLTGKDNKENSDAPKGSLKRKTGVLETKLYVPPTSKKARDGIPKRRAVSVPLPTTEPSVPLKPKASKAPKASSSSSSSSPSSTASAAPKKKTRRPKVNVTLAAVAEEDVEAPLPGPSTPKMTQAQIDSRCYDLTVSPLADVSEAYDAFGETQLVEEDAEEEKHASAASVPRVLPVPSAPQPRLSTKSSMETQLHDYFAEPVLSARSRTFTRAQSLPAQPFGWAEEEENSPTSSYPSFFAPSTTLESSTSISSFGTDCTFLSNISIPLLVTSSEALESPESTPELRTPSPVEDASSLASGLRMTTPERKHVYAAFTFGTPSPTSERRPTHVRSASLDRFGDIAFGPFA